MYDIYALFGLYWQTEPEYCSPMKYGFTPVMPLEYYAEFNKAVFDRIPTGDNTLNNEEVMRICDRNLEWLRKNGEIYDKPKKIEVLYVDQNDFKEKVLYYVKNDYPFVMRGVDLTCFKNMRYDALMKKAGNNKVYMSPSAEESCPDNVFTELKNVAKNKCYITNSTNLFYHYEDLLPDSDMDIIKNILDGYMTNNSKQLFLGVVKGTGTAMHAAYTNNFFIMIQGEKKWTFFNPNQLALIYPCFQEKGIYMASETRFLNMDTYISIDKFPLMKYVERYEIELEERDILYNPMSWFHSVYNKTDISVACSTRWSKSPNIPDAHMLRYGHMINPELRSYVKDIYISTGVLGISQIDEHKHMIGENDPDAIPYWDKYTNDSHKICKDEDCSIHWHKNTNNYMYI
uniref:JmjC domain-containing protein n=1 Tax=viral metagenome TaxID=1070528 RepID=A0A6C0ARM2_9ZZZZ